MKLALALMLLRLIAQLIPPHKRSERYNRWAQEMPDEPSLRKALKEYIWASVRLSLNTPFSLTEDDFKEVSKGDKVILKMLQFYVGLFVVILIPTNIMMFAFGFFSNIGGEVFRLWLGMNTLIGLMAYTAWRGLGVDCPWLRITVLGRLTSFLIACSPFALFHFQPDAPFVLLFGSLSLSFLLIVWHQYWSVQRPLRFRKFKI